jgi:hypothetical protein
MASIADWDWTAIGTILLAVATFALAWQNRAIVRSSREELAETRKDVATAQEQVHIARQALAAQTQPLLSSVPGKQSHLPPSTFGEPGDISADFNEQHGGHMAVPFRNVGNAVAVIKTVMFWMSESGGASGSTGNAEAVALPPGEITQARIELPSNSRFGPEVVLAKSNFSLVLTYADAADQPRGATRLDVHHSSSRNQWYVRQIHFGDDDESVRERPRTSSAPTD